MYSGNITADVPKVNEVDAVLCMPLTENVNLNNINSKTGETACDAFACGPPKSSDDIDAGMCLWGDKHDDPLHLLQVPFDDFGKVKHHKGKYEDIHCHRCKHHDNYHENEDGVKTCTCTPECGSCATPDYDPSNTGVQCVSLKHVYSNRRQGKKNGKVKLIKGAGAVEQDVGIQECGYKEGGTRRPSARGGKYQASIAHYPSNSLQIIDMSKQKLSCQVDLPGRPDRVVYVPPQPGQMESFLMVHDGLETGGKATLIVVGVLGSLIVTWLILCRCRRSEEVEIDFSSESPSSPPTKQDLADVEQDPSSPYDGDHSEKQLPEIS